MTEKSTAEELGVDQEGSTARTEAPTPTPHAHECINREDDVCEKRGYCLCACGARGAFRIEGDTGVSEWHTE